MLVSRIAFRNIDFDVLNLKRIFIFTLFTCLFFFLNKFLDVSSIITLKIDYYIVLLVTFTTHIMLILQDSNPTEFSPASSILSCGF